MSSIKVTLLSGQERLVRLREKLGLSRAQFAVHLGMTEKYIYLVESGRRPVTARLLKLIGLQFGVQVAHSDAGEGPVDRVAETPPSYHAAPMYRVPLLTWIQAGLFTDRTSPPHPGEADDYVWTDVRGARVFALRVKGDSMEPVFHEGEVVLVNPDFECRPDDYVIVKRPDHGSEDATLKQLKKIGAQFFLHPLNPKHPDVPLTKRHRIVGKVVRKQLDF